MKERKIFGIGAVVLMILVAIAPTINGLQLEKQLEKSSSSLNERGPYPDLSAHIKRCEFMEYSLTEDRVKYEIDWQIINEGPLGPWIVPCTLYEKTSQKVYASWEAHFGFFDKTKEGTITLWLTSSADPSVDEERNLAGEIIVFEIHIDDYYSHNNIDEAFVKHWKDSSDYIPTEPQIEASSPRWGTEIHHPDLPNLYYIDILGGNGGRILSNLLISKRMGWVGQGLGYLVNISIDLAMIFDVTILFLSSVESDITKIGEWSLDIIFWFENLVNGIVVPGKLKELIDDFIKFVWPAIKDMAAKAAIYGAAVIVPVYKLWNDANNTYDWSSGDPQLKPIMIDVIVDKVRAGETVQAQCRDQIQTKTRGENEGEGPLKFYFSVSSEPQGNELFQIGIHNCKVTVTGSKHTGSIQSRPLLSYAFSNGYLYWEFPTPGDKSKSVVKQSSADGLKDWLKDRPLSILFEKLLGKTRFFRESEQQTSINRNFDLDALMEKVKLENSQNYKPYEGLEYKPYYPGAPQNPNIVYYRSDQVLVGFKSYVDITKIDKVEGYPVVDKILELNTVIVEIYGIEPDEFIKIVEEREDVEYAEMDYVYQIYMIPNDPLWSEQWGPKAINCPEAWDIEDGYMSDGVAIIDTGCNYNHEDIRCGYSSINYDFVNNDDDPMDDCYVKHGTHCAGIVGAWTNNGKGIAGVAPQAFTDYIKVLDNTGSGYASDVAKGIIRAADSYVDVISMSFGGYGVSVLVHAACDYAYYVQGSLLVAAAGNDGLSRLGYPARFDSVISVGAVDENLKLCSWSNHGPDLDLVAPGDNIISTVGGNLYDTLSGTSMACPHVAGVAALYFGKNPDSTAVLCKGKLFSTAIDLGKSGRDDYYGYGLVNAYGAVANAKTRDNLPHIFDHLSKIKQLITNSPFLQKITKTLLKLG